MSCMMATAVSESRPDVGSSSISTCKHLMPKPAAPLHSLRLLKHLLLLITLHPIVTAFCAFAKQESLCSHSRKLAKRQSRNLQLCTLCQP